MTAFRKLISSDWVWIAVAIVGGVIIANLVDVIAWEIFLRMGQ